MVQGTYPQIQPNSNKTYLISKRLIDVIGSIIGIIVLSPLFLIVAFIIKFEDQKGTIFFKQIRVGKDGKVFCMYKFRSMVTNAEDLKCLLLEKNDVTGPVFKMRNDPRVTKIGKFIRKTSIDELPQLINVLRGDMSLVGPRPALAEEVAKYTGYEKQRLKVTPGLTCYWQVSGRSNLSFEQWMDLDMKYIHDQCFWVDFKLIIKTIFVLLGSKNAY